MYASAVATGVAFGVSAAVVSADGGNDACGSGPFAAVIDQLRDVIDLRFVHVDQRALWIDQLCDRIDLPSVDDDQRGLWIDQHGDIIDPLRVLCDPRADNDDSCAVHFHRKKVDKRSSRVSND